MTYLGISIRPGTCAICEKSFPKGVKVYFDGTKDQGSHLAHAECWETLRASRGVKLGRGEQTRSTEELDPPF